jgi:hypothetical protein
MSASPESLCTSCGTTFKRHSTYCQSCGAPVDDARSARDLPEGATATFETFAAADAGFSGDNSGFATGGATHRAAPVRPLTAAQLCDRQRLSRRARLTTLIAVLIASCVTAGFMLDRITFVRLGLLHDRSRGSSTAAAPSPAPVMTAADMTVTAPPIPVITPAVAVETIGNQQGAPLTPAADGTVVTTVALQQRQFAGACPGEGGCIFQEWLAKSPVMLYDQPSRGGVQATTVSAGERVQGLTSLLVSRPLACVLRRDVTGAVNSNGRPITIPAGTTIATHYSSGEGFAVAEYQGTVISAPVLEQCRVAEAQLWLRVKTSTGVVAWSNERAKFQGTSQYDESLPVAVGAATPTSSDASSTSSTETSPTQVAETPTSDAKPSRAKKVGRFLAGVLGQVASDVLDRRTNRTGSSDSSATLNGTYEAQTFASAPPQLCFGSGGQRHCVEWNNATRFYQHGTSYPVYVASVNAGHTIRIAVVNGVAQRVDFR